MSTFPRSTAAIRPLLVLLVASVSVVACSGGSDSFDSAPSTTFRHVENLQVQSLNSITGQRYDYAVAGDTITVRAPESNDPVKLGRFLDEGSGLIAEAFWQSGQPARTDQEVCVQLASVPDVTTEQGALRVQSDTEAVHLQGIALRVHPGAPGAPLMAITISQYFPWIFDVNAVRVNAFEARASANVTHISSVDFGDDIGRWSAEPGAPDFASAVAPPPWNMCARAIGTTISMMLWPDSAEKPSWTDTDRVHEVKVARGWVFQGYGGGYVASLSPGTAVKFVGLEVTSPY